LYRRILVPVDGSSTSTLGLRHAIGLAKDQGARLRVLNVVDDRVPVSMAEGYAMADMTRVAEEAYRHTGGRAIFATGSPFAPVTVNGRLRATGQANNAFIFPGVGLGPTVCGARCITEDMFAAAGEALAGQVTAEDLASGRIFPSAERLREVAAVVAHSVAEAAYAHCLATRPRPPDLAHYIETQRYVPRYAPERTAGGEGSNIRHLAGTARATASII
jgi:hypothetical protein